MTSWRARSRPAASRDWSTSAATTRWCRRGERLAAWMGEQGLTPGPVLWEVYVTEPSPDMDPADLRSELNWLLRRLRSPYVAYGRSELGTGVSGTRAEAPRSRLRKVPFSSADSSEARNSTALATP